MASARIGASGRHPLRRLPVAQPRRIRRADVDHDKIRQRAQPGHQRRVILRDAFRRRVLVRPKFSPSRISILAAASAESGAPTASIPSLGKPSRLISARSLGKPPQRADADFPAAGAASRCRAPQSRNPSVCHPATASRPCPSRRRARSDWKIRSPSEPSQLGRVGRRLSSGQREHRERHPMRVLGDRAEQSGLENALIEANR